MIYLSGYIIARDSDMWVVVKGEEIVGLAYEASDAIAWVRKQN